MTLGIEPTEDTPVPPRAERVAARGLALSAVACRALLEREAVSAGAEDMRRNVCAWIRDIGIAPELEKAERELLEAPLGTLEHRAVIDGSWISEGMVVLAWALGCTSLPAYDHECDPPEVANAMGFLGDRSATPLESPKLRDPRAIEQMADMYLTLHWRLRQYSLHPGKLDLAEFVRSCTWGPLTIDGLTLLEGDLSLHGAPLHRAAEEVFHTSMSIAQERHRALNWLLGADPVYSEVTTDT